MSEKTFDSSVQNILIAFFALAAIGFVCDAAVTIVRELGPHPEIEHRTKVRKLQTHYRNREGNFRVDLIDECASDYGKLVSCQLDLSACLEAAAPPL